VQDVPPYMIADGNPAAVRGINQIGMERRGFTPETTRLIKEAYRTLYRSKLNIRQAVELLKQSEAQAPEIEHLISFIESSQRGIIR